mmetsp:Transcript_113852/g.201754  ORF Transcript_113852/g.201754 Transcript_113852/m.201754 type:complete len:216 (-) Transcript_113852:739-1386(-)
MQDRQLHPQHRHWHRFLQRKRDAACALIRFRCRQIARMFKIASPSMASLFARLAGLCLIQCHLCQRPRCVSTPCVAESGSSSHLKCCLTSAFPACDILKRASLLSSPIWKLHQLNSCMTVGTTSMLKSPKQSGILLQPPRLSSVLRHSRVANRPVSTGKPFWLHSESLSRAPRPARKCAIGTLCMADGSIIVALSGGGINAIAFLLRRLKSSAQI